MITHAANFLRAHRARKIESSPNEDFLEFRETVLRFCFVLFSVYFNLLAVKRQSRRGVNLFGIFALLLDAGVLFHYSAVSVLPLSFFLASLGMGGVVLSSSSGVIGAISAACACIMAGPDTVWAGDIFLTPVVNFFCVTALVALRRYSGRLARTWGELCGAMCVIAQIAAVKSLGDVILGKKYAEDEFFLRVIAVVSGAVLWTVGRSSAATFLLGQFSARYAGFTLGLGILAFSPLVWGEWTGSVFVQFLAAATTAATLLVARRSAIPKEEETSPSSEPTPFLVAVSGKRIRVDMELSEQFSVEPPVEAAPAVDPIVVALDDEEDDLMYRLEAL